MSTAISSDTPVLVSLPVVEFECVVCGGVAYKSADSQNSQTPFGLVCDHGPLPKPLGPMPLREAERYLGTPGVKFNIADGAREGWPVWRRGRAWVSLDW